MEEETKKQMTEEDEGPEEHSPEMYFGNFSESNPGPTGHGPDVCYSDADSGL